MVYYPIALSDQQAYAAMIERVPIAHSRLLCDEVLSLPIDPSMDDTDVLMICSSIKQYFAA
jgi:dTDP-4-amino-4,6-dideoxygalactose transaminase